MSGFHMQPFFCFYGGKWRIAPRYPRPCHDTIVEPFAGAAGYATRHAERKVILVEKDPRIAALWAYLIRVSSAEVRAIPLMAPTDTVDDLRVCAEAKDLVGFWLNKGAAQPRKSPSSWMRTGMRPRSYWGAEVRDRIASQVERIRHWRVIEGSYEIAPAIEATWFVDPPYVAAGHHYRCSSRELEFSVLAAWCRSRPGLVIVCEAEVAAWLPFKPFHVSKASGSKNSSGRSREVVAIFHNRRAASVAV